MADRFAGFVYGLTSPCEFFQEVAPSSNDVEFGNTTRMIHLFGNSSSKATFKMKLAGGSVTSANVANKDGVLTIEVAQGESERLPLRVTTILAATDGTAIGYW